MAAVKAILTKEVGNKMYYIFPRTSADMVEYKENVTIKDEFDKVEAALAAVTATANEALSTANANKKELTDARVAKTDGEAKKTLKERLDLDWDTVHNELVRARTAKSDGLEKTDLKARIDADFTYLKDYTDTAKQSVTDDLNSKYKELKDADAQITADYKASDTAIQNDLNVKYNELVKSDVALQNDIDAKYAELKKADSDNLKSLQDADNAIKADLKSKYDELVQSDEDIQADLDSKYAELVEADQTAGADLAAKYKELKDADAKITTDYKAADAAIQEDLDDKYAELVAADTAIKNDLAGKYKELTDADTAIKSDLKTKYDALVAADAKITTDYQAADAAITNAYKAADTAITNAYKAADTALGTRIDEETVKSVTRSGLTFTAHNAAGDNLFTFTQQDTTYKAGECLTLDAATGNTFNHNASKLAAGSYGPAADVAGSNNTTIVVPQITTDKYGHVTAVTNRTYTSKDTVYTHPNSGVTAGSIGLSADITGTGGTQVNIPYITYNAQGHITAAVNHVLTTVDTNTDTKYTHPDSTLAAGSYGPTANVNGTNGATIVVPQITTDKYGHVTAVTNRTYTSVNTDTNTTYNVFGKSTSAAAGTNGLVPGPGAGTDNRYLRNDGTWQVPPNTTYGVFGKSTASANGTNGLVPGPGAGADNRYLRNDGTWQVPPNTNTTYSAATGQLTLRGTTFGLATSGVTAKAYGPTANVNGTNGTTILVPQITVDAYGRVTAVAERTYTSVNTDTDTKYTHPSDGKNTGSFGLATDVSGSNGTKVNIPYITVNAAGHVTAAANHVLTTVDTSTSSYTHPNSGVTANTYGPSQTTAFSASNGTKVLIPKFSVNAQGHITSASTIEMTAVNTDTNTDTKYTAGTGLSLSTSNAFSLAASGVKAGTYGSATAVPVITVDTYGRITSATTAAVNAGSTFTLLWTNSSPSSAITSQSISITLLSCNVLGVIYKDTNLTAYILSILLANYTIQQQFYSFSSSGTNIVKNRRNITVTKSSNKIDIQDGTKQVQGKSNAADGTVAVPIYIFKIV